MANLVYGTNSSEIINALDGVTNGYDIIYGYGGNDSIYGLGGDDYIVGGAGADALNGDTGSDTASLYCSPVLRHPAGLIQAANFRSAIAF